MLAEGVHGGQLTGGAGQRTQNRLLNFLLRHARKPLPGCDKCKAKYLYDKVYCARGDMEKRIKDCQQLDLLPIAPRGHHACQSAQTLVLLGSARRR